MKSSITRIKARRFRAERTDAEQALWLQLRDRRLAGFKFRRQCPVGPFFADFACWRGKLIIEVDGGQHTERKAYDQQRTRFLEQQGFTVIRFWNDEVLLNWEGVRQVILWHLQRTIPTHSGPTPDPHPDPLPRGEGAVRCSQPARATSESKK